MKNIILLVLALSVSLYAQQSSTLIFGKADTKVLTWENLCTTSSDSVADSVSVSSTVSSFHLQIWVQSVQGDTGDVAKVEYYNFTTNKRATKWIAASAKDTVYISGLRICYHDSLVANDRLLIQYRDDFPAKVDTVGGLWIARWDSCYVDTVTTVSATPDTIEFTDDFPEGLTVITSHNLQFRTNRITGWIMLAAGTNIFIPIRHTTSDTCFVKTISSVPDFTLVRGK